MQDYYQVLGVSKDAQTYQILTAYNNKLAEVRSASLAACVHHYCMYKCAAALSFLSCSCVGPNQCCNIWLGRLLPSLLCIEKEPLVSQLLQDG